VQGCRWKHSEADGRTGKLLRDGDRRNGSRGDCDFLFVRTGFGKHRSNAETYIEHNPGFSATAADFLMQRFPELKALAVDFASVASAAHMEEGCMAHRVFLGCGRYSDRPVLLVEDIRFPQPMPSLKKIYLIPWQFEGPDSAPCTLFADAADDTPADSGTGFTTK
jgi:kynurenine formamidase